MCNGVIPSDKCTFVVKPIHKKIALGAVIECGLPIFDIGEIMISTFFFFPEKDFIKIIGFFFPSSPTISVF